MRLGDSYKKAAEWGQYVYENISVNGKDVLIEGAALLALCQLSTMLLKSWMGGKAWIGGPIVFSAVLLSMKPKFYDKLKCVQLQHTQAQEPYEKAVQEKTTQIQLLQAQKKENADYIKNKKDELTAFVNNLTTGVTQMQREQALLEKDLFTQKQQIQEQQEIFEELEKAGQDLYKEQYPLAEKIHTLKEDIHTQEHIKRLQEQEYESAQVQFQAKEKQIIPLKEVVGVCETTHQQELASLEAQAKQTSDLRLENFRLEREGLSNPKQAVDPLSVFVSMSKNKALRILGVAEKSTNSEITNVYRSKAKVYHIDKCIDRHAFQILGAARDCLIPPPKQGECKNANESATVPTKYKSDCEDFEDKAQS